MHKKTDRMDLCRQMMELYILFHDNGYVIRSADIASFNLVWASKKRQKALLKIYGLGCVKKGLGVSRISSEKCKLRTQMYSLPAPLRVFPIGANPTTYSEQKDWIVLGELIFRIFNRRNCSPTSVTSSSSYDLLRHRRYEAFKAVELLIGKEGRLAATSDLRFHPLWWTECQSNEFIKTVAAVIDQQEAAAKKKLISAEKDVKKVLGNHENLKIALKPHKYQLEEAEDWLEPLEEREKKEIKTHNKTGQWFTFDGKNHVDLIKVMRHSTVHLKEDSLFARFGNQQGR